ncbi:MAG: hypothetical protein M3471_01780 [Actinomycetota bacterium]|nr:hypothetical protein [Actinomycetota bacterium]
MVPTDVARFSDSDFPPAVKEAIVAEGLDRETGAAFRLAHQALHSSVERIVRSVYEFDPGTIGTFDVVNVGDLLLHLENPLAALRSIRSVTAGVALIADCFDPNIASGLTRYLGGWASVPMWLPSIDALGVVDAGFSGVEVRAVYTEGTGVSTRPLGWRPEARDGGATSGHCSWPLHSHSRFCG